MVVVTRIGVRFVPSHKPRGRSPDFGTFGQFMVSDQMRRPTVAAAVDIVAIAKASVTTKSGGPRSDDPRSGTPDKPHYVDAFSIQSIGLQTLVFDSRAGKMNPHVLVQISNHAENAIPMEFGSGWPSRGRTKGRERIEEQGGWNKAKRPLGRAGRKVGRAVEK